ncbi:MAG: hypothetical protein IT378_08165 [Sandaracinaceae bacterium]|nr:hypothetical protein [Sandaracinaceae bacterium]
MHRVSKSGVYTSAIDAETSSAAALAQLRAALGSLTGAQALAWRRAVRILEAAEGVRTDDVCLVLEIEKLCAEEPEAPEELRRLVRA